jgi:hypothetical protein
MDEIRVICSVLWEWFAVAVWTLFGRIPPGEGEDEDSS